MYILSRLISISFQLEEACLQLGILDIWGDDPDTIYSLTEEDIINDINTAQFRFVDMYNRNVFIEVTEPLTIQADIINKCSEKLISN